MENSSTFDLNSTPEGLTLMLRAERTGLLGRLLSKKSARDLQHLPPEERQLLLALADLRAIGDEHAGALEIGSSTIRMPHRVAAALNSRSADVLGLPPLIDLTLRTDVEGIVGSPSFRLRYDWMQGGRRQTVSREGAILKTSEGTRRIPLWLMDALDVADGFRGGAKEVDHWEALARFRQALDPGISVPGATSAAKVSMTDFLSGLEVRLADRFAIEPNAAGDDFNVVPFSERGLEIAGFAEGQADIPQASGELEGQALDTFQRRLRERGAMPAFRLGPGSYLVVDKTAAPALEVMAEMQRAPISERAAFVRNPRARITDAVEDALRKRGALEGLSPEAEEEVVERAAGPVFVETREFSERVTGFRIFEKMLETIEGSGTTWLPEAFARRLAEHLDTLSHPELSSLRGQVVSALEAGQSQVPVGDMELPARPEALRLLDTKLAAAAERDDDAAGVPPEHGRPIVLNDAVNFDELQWQAKLQPRAPRIGNDISPLVRTRLKQHQVESLSWQISAWKAGLPGVLNADEPGLGKTLQTIAFLAWMKSHMAAADAGERGPVLVVAPTSLLENWEQEVDRHLEQPGLGHLVRLYGSATGARKLPGARGMDTDTGEAKLDLAFLQEAIAEGRAHRFWLLTTYTTLVNYQHSLGRIRFSAAVFDEIQALKNPDSLRAHAARSMNADFRIGLTGTPIENSADDLWAIIDQLAPGALGTLKDFRSRYSNPEPASMQELHDRVFQPIGTAPPLALRRLKDFVARDLPQKTRRLHPRSMPPVQAIAYEDARLKLAQGGRGAALKMLHHIRSVSVHPLIDEGATNEDFVSASARLQAVYEILKKVRDRGEKVLVFIEHRQMQYRFVELIKAEFGLPRVDLINGDTPIPQRQAIVNRFQRHLENDGGFDVLVLGPKAAGTGLTLTAATHVIHLSRWWNPAVEEQCNDRIHRIGQTRPVTVHIPMAIHEGYGEHSFDCLLQSLMQRKRRLATSALWPMGDTDGDVGDLQRMISAEHTKVQGDAIRVAIAEMFVRDDLKPPIFAQDGSVDLE